MKAKLKKTATKPKAVATKSKVTKSIVTKSKATTKASVAAKKKAAPNKQPAAKKKAQQRRKSLKRLDIGRDIVIHCAHRRRDNTDLRFLILEVSKRERLLRLSSGYAKKLEKIVIRENYGQLKNSFEQELPIFYRQEEAQMNSIVRDYHCIESRTLWRLLHRSPAMEYVEDLPVSLHLNQALLPNHL